MANDLHPEGEFCCGACKQAAKPSPQPPAEQRPLLRYEPDAAGLPQGLVLKWTYGALLLEMPVTRTSIAFGRSPEGVDVVVKNDMMSRRQTRFVFEDGQVFVEDMGSTCGTLLDDHKVQREALRAGSRVWFANVIAWVEHG